MNSMNYPERFGLPCWEKDQADKCINTVAQVTQDKVSLFLAAHSPIKKIRDVKANSLINEEESFQKLFSKKGEIRGVVRGASGTGKSHLIHWINLRAEYAAKNSELSLDKFKIVMVRRETGSLKAALRQIVDQLGEEFSQYIEDIKNSLDKFSDRTFYEALIQELALEINSKWEQRGHDPLPKYLRPLGNVLLSPGYRRWLRRDGGVIAQKVIRFTESSNQDDREKVINFTNNELIPPPGYLHKREDADQVYDFIDDLTYDNDVADEAVKVLNLALTDAQREITGIKGAKLKEIFIAIRRKLFDQGKELAVFIEDVTAASGGLDLDLFQAFEPKAENNLCRMIALLGMTNDGWSVLPDNEKDRVNFQFDVGENANKWAIDHHEVAVFAARYLNAIRHNDQEIDLLARNRFDSDIPHSKCDECPHLNNCHDTFGYVQLENNVRIGLFPFSELAPQKLLKALTEERHRSSQRGLLDYVLNVTLSQSYNQFAQNTFPNAKNFGVVRSALTYWSEVENKYLGGIAWSSESQRHRVRFLAEFWFNADSANESAALLESYRLPLSFPDFSAKPKILSREGEPLPTPLPMPEVPTDDHELKDLLTRLEEWSHGNKLTADPKFRTFLSEIISKSIKWQDHRSVPVKFALEITRGTNPIRIEDQISSPASQKYIINFYRDVETLNFIEALVRYEKEGKKKSWDFENGELHKRRVYRWLRKNQQRIIQSIEPDPPSLSRDAVIAASQLLGLTAILRLRTSLPKRDLQKRISEVFFTIWEEHNRPNFLTDALGLFIKDIEIKWKAAKEFLISELGVGQGISAPKDYIDPLPILEALDKFEDKLTIESLPKEINENFWKPRFEAVAKLSAYSDINKAYNEEKRAIEERLESLKKFLFEYGFVDRDLSKELKACIKEIIEVVEVQRRNLKYPNNDFDNLWNSRLLQSRGDVWSTIIAQADRVVADSKKISVICFNSAVLNEAFYNLTIVTKKHLAKIEKELADQENPGGIKHPGTKDDLLNELKKISELFDEVK